MTAGRPTIPADRYAGRLASAARNAAAQDVGALLIGVGGGPAVPAGYVALPLERLTMLVIPASGRPTLVAPRLEALPAKGSPAVAAGSRGPRDVDGDAGPDRAGRLAR